MRRLLVSSKIIDLSIAKKLWTLVALAAFSCLLVAAFSLYDLKQELLHDRKVEVRNLVESTHTLIEHYVELEKVIN